MRREAGAEAAQREALQARLGSTAASCYPLIMLSYTPYNATSPHLREVPEGARPLAEGHVLVVLEAGAYFVEDVVVTLALTLQGHATLLE